MAPHSHPSPIPPPTFGEEVWMLPINLRLKCNGSPGLSPQGVRWSVAPPSLRMT
jgi:hypothetical protein